MWTGSPASAPAPPGPELKARPCGYPHVKPLLLSAFGDSLCSSLSKTLLMLAVLITCPQTLGICHPGSSSRSLIPLPFLFHSVSRPLFFPSSHQYLLSMVVAYFSRAGLFSWQYQRIHFFLAL